MSHARRIERALRASIDAASAGAPPRLAAALRHAVFPGGARIRPRLCLAVAAACGDSCPALSDAAAAAVELVHCASLVHDDLPCFDNASTRRGRPSVHRAFGEPIAVLAGDALIVAAFESVARAGAAAPDRLARVIEIVARGVSSPHGIIAGQAWESEPHIPVITYRRAKTAALFEAAAAAGAAAAGDDPAAFRAFGERIGEAYQVADDILDVASDPSVIGKPVGRDAALGRPNSARDLGVERSRELLEQLVREALDEMPARRQTEEIRAWAADTVTRLLSAGRPPARSKAPMETADHPEMAGAEGA
jgi:geranylgeranyl diphosphate synthase, type II